MNSQNPKRRLLAACMLVGLLASTGLATRQIRANRSGTKCLSIFASEESALITDGCNSPVGFCAAGTFRGNHGFKGSSF